MSLENAYEAKKRFELNTRLFFVWSVMFGSFVTTVVFTLAVR